MIALLEAKAAGLWSRMHCPGSLPRGGRGLHTTATLALAIERLKAIEAVKGTWIRIGKSCKSTAL